MKARGDEWWAPVLCTGIQGSGKTYTLQSIAVAEVARGSARVLVLDPNGEWPGAPFRRRVPVLRYVIVRTADGARRALEAGESYVVARIEPADDPKATAPMTAAAEALARVAIEAGGVVLVCPEVHLCYPNNGRLPPGARDLVHRGRHLACTLWGDTQHFRDLHTELRNAARLVCLHATDSARDERAIADEYHAAALPLVTERALDRMVAGEPGWHVAMHRGRRRPPFRLVRV